MCGINGILHRDERPVDRELLTRMSRTQRHRGPDEEGYLLRDGWGLGFQRLSIIDLSGGHQPMTTEDDSVALVFNGEIYNFQELRQKLEQTGRYQFRTHSDTEVLLRLYQEYGEECLSYLRGMFAFAIWDSRRRRLFAARDRFGKKPFFYFVTPDGTLVFASELKALREHPACPRQISLTAIDLYLSLQYIPAPRTIYEGVFKLPAAHALCWSPDEPPRVQRYWELSYDPKATLPYSDAKERLRALMNESVRLRMIADVPLGAFLSGGVDSSLIVALMAQQSSQPVKTFSIGFEEEAYSELPYARQVAERYKTDHREFIVKPELTDVLPKLAWFYSEPYADSSALPSYYLCRETRQHVTVALNGDGGDEMFAGYLRYRAMWAMRFWNHLPSGLRRGISRIAEQVTAGPPLSASYRIQRLLKVGSLEEMPQYLRTLEYFHEEERAELWATGPGETIRRCRADSEALFLETLSGTKPREWLDRLLYLDIHHYLPDCLMVKMDIASMSNSLETRSPLLDHVLAEEVARWPVSWKYQPPQGSKSILKDTFAPDLPRDILRRGKQGFGIPLSEWFRGPLREFLKDTLLSPKALGRGYFRPEVVRRYVDEHQSGRRERGYGLWALLMLELWFQRFEP